MAEAAVALGLSRDTFIVYQKNHPEFSDAVKEFRQRSQSWWESKGRKGTFGETDGFSATGYIFQMKNRFPDDWRDKREVEDVTPEDAPSNVSSKALARAIAAVLSKGIAGSD